MKFSNIIENCKENMLKSLYQQNCTMIDSLLSIISLLDKIDDYEPDIQFNRVAKNHRNQCPLYVPDLMDEDITTNPVQEPIKSGSPESAVWLNDLLATFISEWRHSEKFNSYICRRLKKVYNKDNPDYIGEIDVKSVELGNESPEIKDFIRLETDNDLEFFYEFDLWFRGDLKMHLEFELKWSVATILVNVKVILRSFYAKLRFFYTTSSLGSSWYSFISEPVHQISLEPVLGKMNKIALSKFPQINALIVSILSKKIRKYVWPNRRSVKIPKGNKSEFGLD